MIASYITNLYYPYYLHNPYYPYYLYFSYSTLSMMLKEERGRGFKQAIFWKDCVKTEKVR